MAGLECFIEPFGLCISQANAVSGALVAAVASLATTGGKIWFDLNVAGRREAFERRERELREAFERSQSQAAADAEERIQRNVHSYVKLEKWREESWQRLLRRLEQAAQELTRTSSGLTALIDEGPHYDDLRMIQETAKILDVFGDFQSSVGHFSLPASIADASQSLVSHMTKVLLTLSPIRAVRESDERRQMLIPLKEELIRLTKSFMHLCGEFERTPTKFIACGPDQPRSASHSVVNANAPAHDPLRSLAIPSALEAKI